MNGLMILAVGCLAVTVSISGEAISFFEESGWNVSHVNSSSVASVDFYLYTKVRPNKPTRVVATNMSVSASNFNSDHPTKFIIHDFYCSHLTPTIKKIRRTWMNLGQYNIFVVDWPIARNRLFSNAELAVPKVGENIGHFINYLAENHGMPLETTHIIGYGLGAHVAGCAGKNIKNGQVGTIIGLDPASSSLEDVESSKRLNSTDAYYVETIHTESRVLGEITPIGKASFYPNGGVSQPGCNHFTCHHRRSAEYYIESIIKDDFAAIRCNSFEDAVAKRCGLIHSSVRMGGHKYTFMVAGIFYVPVNEKPPYGILS